MWHQSLARRSGRGAARRALRSWEALRHCQAKWTQFAYRNAVNPEPSGVSHVKLYNLIRVGYAARRVDEPRGFVAWLLVREDCPVR